MRFCVLQLVTCALLALPVVSRAAVQGEEPDRDWGERELRRTASQLVGQAVDLSPTAFDNLVSAALESPALSAAQQEQLRLAMVMAFRDLQPDPVSRGFLEQQLHYEPQVLDPHPESRGSLLVARYRIPAAARGTLNLWERQAWASHGAHWMATRDDALITKFMSAEAGSAVRAGLRDAVAAAGTSDQTWLSGELKLTSSFHQVSPLAVTVALQLSDTNLAGRIIDHGSTYAASRLLRDLHISFAPDAAIPLLEQALAKSALSGLSVTALGKVADKSAVARVKLYALLGDPRRGGDAALALAKVGDQAVTDHLAQLLSSKVRLEVQRAALALKLTDTALARGALQDFVDGESKHPNLKTEVAKWLQ